MREVALLIPWRVGRDGRTEYFLQQRTDRKKWAFFGGGREEGETFAQAVVREAREELDIALPRQELGRGHTPLELLFHLPLWPSLGIRVFPWRCREDLPAGCRVLEGKAGEWWRVSALPAMSLSDRMLLRLVDLRLRVLSQPAVPSPIRSPALTIDLEEHWHIAGRTRFERFAARETDLEAVVSAVLDFLDRERVKATFFTVGDLARQRPALVAEIARRGHELAAHGLHHEPAVTQSPESFREDVTRTRQILEDLSGTAVKGYRAPAFSWPGVPEQSWQFYQILQEAGYLYSSSVIPVPLLGKAGLPTVPYEAWPGVWEFPLPAWGMPGLSRHLNRPERQGRGEFRTAVFPYSGGVFLRLTGKWLASLLLGYHQNRNGWTMFYLHPRELSPTGLGGLDDLYLNWVERKLLNFRAKQVKRVFCNLIAEHGGCPIASYLAYLQRETSGLRAVS